MSRGSNRVKPKIYLPHWHAARRRCSPMWIATGSASVISALLHFYDTSKKGTGAVHMQTCGTTQGAAYAARQRLGYSQMTNESHYQHLYFGGSRAILKLSG